MSPTTILAIYDEPLMDEYFAPVVPNSRPYHNSNTDKAKRLARKRRNTRARLPK